ncbi:MAG: rod-determining factor RdfA [Haloferacaceae archaeon]
MTGNASADDGCKVDRVAAAYGLSDLDDLLRARHAEGASLRDLAAVVDARVLEAAVEAAGADLAGDGLALREALVGDVPPERRADVRDRLRYAGVDLDAVESDFVSHQTVATHLRDCLGVDTSRDGVETVEAGREVMERTRERTERVVGGTLDRLRRVDALDGGEFRVSASLTVTCERCGRTHRVGDLLDRGGCACARQGD